MDSKSLIENILKEIAEKMRGTIEDIYKSTVTARLSNIIESSYNEELRNEYPQLSFGEQRKHPFYNVMCQVDANFKYLDKKKVRIGYLYTDVNLKPDYETILDNEAERYAQQVIEKFVVKNTNKLVGIIDDKGNLSKHTSSLISTGSTIQGQILFEFKDGSSFMIDNKVVTKWRFNERKGSHTVFHQFPTTFHDIVMVNGNKRKMMSEDEMNLEFIKG